MEEEIVRHLGSTAIIPWTSHELPEALDALILPEDSYLLLQAVTKELDPDATPLDLWIAMERAARTEKHPLGSVLIADGRPQSVKYIASVIVYDFETEQICRKEVVLAGLQSAVSELGKRGCETIGIFPLGTMRGGISKEDYLEVVHEIISHLEGASPRTVYLLGQHPEPDSGRSS